MINKVTNKGSQMSKRENCYRNNMSPCSNAVYGLGLLGAAVYYWQTSPMLTDKLVGLIKAIFWPAFLVYKAMQGWGM